MEEILFKALQYGLFGLLGVLIATFANKRKSVAEIEKLKEETEKLNLENQNLRSEQMNILITQNNELQKAREELKAKLYIANEEKLLLAKQLQEQRIESRNYQTRLEELERKVYSQHKDITAIQKKTGQLPSREEL
jgi:hypothetical protein